MNYPCAKFGDLRYSRFRTERYTDRENRTIAEADQRYTHATTVGVSKDCDFFIIKLVYNCGRSLLRKEVSC